MSNHYSANRRFERMFPKIANQKYLRTTDPKKYGLELESLNSSPRNLEGKLVARIIYTFDKEGNLIGQRTERVNQ